MSKSIVNLQPHDRIKLLLSGDCYQILKIKAAAIETVNLNNGYSRTFRYCDLLGQAVAFNDGCS